MALAIPCASMIYITKYSINTIFDIIITDIFCRFTLQNILLIQIQNNPLKI